MAVSSSDSNGFLHPFRWVPEFVKISQRRLRTQGRLLLAAMAVGVIAGLGGVVFTVTCQAVVHYTLEGIAGYHAAGPAHEAHVDWFIPIVRAFSPWLLLIVPTVGGLISGEQIGRRRPRRPSVPELSAISYWLARRRKISRLSINRGSARANRPRSINVMA